MIETELEYEDFLSYSELGGLIRDFKSHLNSLLFKGFFAINLLRKLSTNIDVVQNSSLSLIPWGVLVQELQHRVCPTQRQGYWTVTPLHGTVIGCKLTWDKGRKKGKSIASQASPGKVAPIRLGKSSEKDAGRCH